MSKNKDLQEILDGFERASSGDFSTRIKLSGKDPDLVTITKGFNNMIKDLRDSADLERYSQAAHERATNKLKKIFEASNDIILQVNKYGTFVDINNRVKDILGYKPVDLIGKHFARSGAVPAKQIPKLTKAFKDAITSGKATDVTELELKAKDGSIVLMEASTKLIRREDEIEGAVVILRDITKRRQAEEALLDHKDRLRSVIASVEDLVFMLDEDLRFVKYYQSPEHPEMHAKPQDYIGKSFKDVFPRSVTREFEKVIHTCMNKKKNQQLDYPWNIPGGDTLWFNARLAPRLDSEDNISGVTVVVRNITPRIKIEQALQDSQKKYKKIFENSPQGFILLDRDGYIIDVNKKICDWLGYKPEELLGKNHLVYPFLTRKGKAKAMVKFTQRMTGKVVPGYDLEFITKRGETFIGEVLAMQIRDDEGKIQQILAMITDITDRK